MNRERYLIERIDDANAVGFAQIFKETQKRSNVLSVDTLSISYPDEIIDQASQLLGASLNGISLLDYAILKMADTPKKSIKYRNMQLIVRLLLEVFSHLDPRGG